MVSKDFIFGDYHLRDFGLVMANPDELDNSGLSRDILKGTQTAFRSQAVHYGASYNSVIVLSFFVIKFHCSYNDSEISPYELRKIQAWLASSKLPQPLFILSRDGIPIEYNGIFTNISSYAYNGLNGLKLTFKCDSPFVYDTKKISIHANDARNGVVKRIFCDTDEINEMIYPTITFHPNSACIVSFTNHTDNDSIMCFSLPQKYKEVLIDCKWKRIIADGKPLSLSEVGLNIHEVTDCNNVNTGIFRMYWLSFLPKKNIVTISGDGDFTIVYKNLQKLGGLLNV